MTLDPNMKTALRERLAFYREMGIGPLYRRPVPEGASHVSLRTQEMGAAAAVEESIAAVEPQAMSEEALPNDGKRATKNGVVLPPASSSLVQAGEQDAECGDPAALLEAIRAEIGPHCTRCKLAKLGRKQVVFGTGNPGAELMFVGEGPGADEDEQGLPFVGRAGQLLNNMIGAMGLKREQVYIANVVKCRPPQNRTPERDECETCSPFLMRQIRAVRPKIIVALGATAAKNMLGVNDSMASMRGRLYDFSPARRLDDPELFECKLAVTYHPAFLLRDPRQKKEAWKDLQIVMRYLGLAIPHRSKEQSE